MMKMSIFGAAAILITAAASPSITQAAGCALYDPSCATYPMPNNEGAGKARTVRVDDGTQQNIYRSAARTARIEQRAAVGARHYANDAGGPVRAAGAVAAGTVGAAGAIATAPFRTADSYAYYNEGYSGWDHRSYAERNGFVCTPGELFKGFDGRLHVCQ
jgi:hypothetical protein